mgnify:CR=1 FL=1
MSWVLTTFDSVLRGIWRNPLKSTKIVWKWCFWHHLPSNTWKSMNKEVFLTLVWRFLIDCSFSAHYQPSGHIWADFWLESGEILENPLKSSENGVFGITFRQTLEKVWKRRFSQKFYKYVYSGACDSLKLVNHQLLVFGSEQCYSLWLTLVS